MDRLKKFQLIKRSLGLRHKLKVHDSMKQPETHEDLASNLMARWELEDELKAIEEIIVEDRSQNVSSKKAKLLGNDEILFADEIAKARALEEDDDEDSSTAEADALRKKRK